MLIKKPSILLAVLSLAAVLLATPTSAVQPAAVAPTSIVLKAPFEVDSYRLRPDATFTPASPGTLGYLQVKRIKDGVWVTVDSAPQDSNGKVDFYLGNPLEVEHEYRAVPSGAAVKSNIVKASGPLLTKSTGLATAHFNSNDGEAVDTRSNYFKGEFAMKAGANCEAEGAGKNPPAPLKAEMKGRGNYSWSFEKKGFTLKLDKGKDLCGMGDSKKWALVANHYDRSLLRNDVAYHVGKQFTNLQWTPDQMPVDLYVNGSYRGNYSLVERITATGSDSPADGGRVPIQEFEAPDSGQSITGGYILEWDFRHDAFSNFWVSGRGWNGLKEPEDEEWSRSRYDYIHDYVEKADAALYKLKFDSGSDDWKNYIDMASAVDYYLAMEYLKPVDGHMWASVYMYKPVGGKLKMGPLWDFDLAMGSANRAGNVVSPYSYYLRNNLQVSAMHPENGSPKFDTWFNLLNQSPEFRSAARNRWAALQPGNKIDPSSFISSRKSLISKSASENYKKWSYSKKISPYQMIESSWTKDVERLDRWMEIREDWLDSNL